MRVFFNINNVFIYIFLLVFSLGDLHANANTECKQLLNIEAVDINKRDTEELREELTKIFDSGNLVLVMRHAIANVPTDMKHCLQNNRGISEEGIIQAQNHYVGLKMISNNLNPKVLVSPYCRTIETAINTFLDDEPIIIESNLKLAKKGERIEWLKEKIQNYQGKENLFMITHSQNIEAISNLDIDHEDHGIILVYQRSSDNQRKLIGCIWPEDYGFLLPHKDDKVLMTIPLNENSSEVKEVSPPLIDSIIEFDQKIQERQRN